MKKSLSVILAAVILVAAVAAAVPVSASSPFDDVAETRWSYSAIVSAVAKKYMNGVGERKFSPEGTLTRAMVATVLWRREGSPAPAAPSAFSDVPAGTWYTDAVAWAEETGVVNGVSATKFAPENNVTREQLATMLYRFSADCPVSVPDRADLDAFPDGGSVSPWADEAMRWAVEASLIKGKNDGSLDPGGYATREQFATIIDRFDKTFILDYTEPKLFMSHTERDYPLVEDADFYVATDGDDTADGSFERPFRSFARAIEAVRTVEKTAGRGGVTVAFKAGDYGPLHVSMTAEDSGSPDCKVTYCKYGDGDVVFNNGIDLYAASFSPLSEEEKTLFNSKHAEKIKKYDISALFDAGLDKDSIIVFSEDWLCVPARYPNRYPNGSDNLLFGATSNTKTDMKITDSNLKRKLAGYSAEAIASMKIYGYIIWGYEKTSYNCTTYDPETAILATDYDKLNTSWNGAEGLGIRIAVVDVARELDYTDEYWIDAETKTLYVFSPSGTYHIPVEGTMVAMDRTDDVTFCGLTFLNTTEQFIAGELCHGVTIDRCRFRGVSSKQGVRFIDCTRERALDLTITDSEFSRAYGASVYVNGKCTGADRYSKDANVLFDNNLVSSSNLVFDNHNAVDLVNCSDLDVTHNRFEHTSRGSLSFSLSYNVLIEYNDFDSAMINSEDGGVLYSAGSVDGRHITVRHNLFNQITSEGLGAFGYYVDDNTAGTDIYANLFFHNLFPVVIHKGRDNYVHDNVFIGDEVGVALSIGQMHAVEEYGEEAPAKNYDVRQTTRSYQSVFDNIEAYPEFRAGIEKWCPEILNYHLDYSRLDDPNFVMIPVNTIRNNVHINRRSSFTEPPEGDEYLLRYTVVEGCRGYTLEENPVFVNPTIGDYRIRSDAGVEDIEFEKIGRY